MPLIVNGVEIENLIVINTATGEQVDIETLQDQLGDILFQKQTAPAWFNYTGIDINGNYEGTSAYDGTAVAYGLGKPTVTVADDGTETVSWKNSNGFNDDYFISIYGDSYVKSATSSSGLVQYVDSTFVMPDTYKGKPVTTLLENSFPVNNMGSNTTNWYQAYFYTHIVWGKNITTIQSCALMQSNIKPIFELPNTIEKMSGRLLGALSTTSDVSAYKVVVNSNIRNVGTTDALYDFWLTTIFNENVTEVNDLLDNGSLTKSYVWVFKQPENVNVLFSFNTKPKTAVSATIYTDNSSVKNYDWSTNANATITFKSLSEYVG